MKSTVRIGTLTPTPSVSVPQISLSSPSLGQTLDQQPVLGQQAGVVDADAVTDVPPQVLADRRVEAEAARPLAHLRLLVLRQDVEAHQVLGLSARPAG